MSYQFYCYLPATKLYSMMVKTKLCSLILIWLSTSNNVLFSISLKKPLLKKEAFVETNPVRTRTVVDNEIQYISSRILVTFQ